MECFAASTEALAEAYAREILNKKSDICNSDKVVDACKILVGAVAELRTKKQMRL